MQPEDIEEAHDVAEFVADCDVQRVDQEAGRLRFTLQHGYQDRYLLDIATRRVPRNGDQIHLYDPDEREDLYRV